MTDRAAIRTAPHVQIRGRDATMASRKDVSARLAGTRPAGATRGHKGKKMSEQTPPTGGVDTATPDTGQSSAGDAVRALVMAASIGAAVIHFAYAPVHMEENTVHGLFFLLMGWVQLGIAFALYRWKSARWPWMAAIGASAAF